ncbi:30S ribosomal protein S14 type Z [Mycobacterium kansasii 662]|uniref:30S ribosomal protein S14 type Z n=1 Tax=Mycobacterium kansasii 662 TaxID=1299326 RepID=X7ZQV5_MYCKA|nr:30S ribosomal protein S14 [Mycobacterium kansasii]EUA21060.1 30S ribosomal protein S14 type Z [Mycobacterium kansasii 662]
MAKKALVNKAARKPKFRGARLHPMQQVWAARARCFRKFGLCRICLREMAHAGELPGVQKSSW